MKRVADMPVSRSVLMKEGRTKEIMFIHNVLLVYIHPGTSKDMCIVEERLSQSFMEVVFSFGLEILLEILE